MTYGFIGLGNLASSILVGLKSNEKFKDDLFVGYNRTESKTTNLKDNLGLIPAENAADVARKSDVVILAVKPAQIPQVLAEIKGECSAKKLVISVAAGLETGYYDDVLPGKTPFVRAMPNLNVRCGAGATAICGGKYATQETMNTAANLFAGVGSVFALPEDMFSAFAAIGSSSAAYAYMFVDALARAGVREGMSKQMALYVAAAATMGSAKMILESGEHPWNLVDAVCSPGGTTVEGVEKLQALGFESAVHQAVAAAIEKEKALRK